MTRNSQSEKAQLVRLLKKEYGWITGHESLTELRRLVGEIVEDRLEDRMEEISEDPWGLGGRRKKLR